MNENRTSFILEAIEELKDVLLSKNQDYRIAGEFSNFEFAAQVTNLEVEDVILSEVAKKLGRIQGLRLRDESALLEPLDDSYKDLAGYAILLHAYRLSQDIGNDYSR